MAIAGSALGPLLGHPPGLHPGRLKCHAPPAPDDAVSPQPLDNTPAAAYRISTMNDKAIQSGLKPRSLAAQQPGERDGKEHDGDTELARLAKALGHPARVKIMRLLLQRTECLCGEICDYLPLAQSTVSQHLKVLKAAGLIQGEITRPRICYCADTQRLEVLRGLVQGLCESVADAPAAAGADGRSGPVCSCSPPSKR